MSDLSNEAIDRAAETRAREYLDTQRGLGDSEGTILRHVGIGAAKAAEAWIAFQFLAERQRFMEVFCLTVQRKTRMEPTTPAPNPRQG